MIPQPSSLRPVLRLEFGSLCTRCLSRISRPPGPPRRALTTTRRLRDGFSTGHTPVKALRKEYFSSDGPKENQFFKNESITAFRASNLASPTKPGGGSTSRAIGNVNTPGDGNAVEELPHRRRKRLKEESAAVAPEHVIPPDASSRLSTISSALPETSFRRRFATYLALTKPRLSFLIVLTTTTTYSLYPMPTFLALDPSLAPLPTLSTSTLTLLYLTTGTFLSCASANTLNMFFEPQYDALMSRTRNRPLVRKLLTKRAALLFAIGTAATGLTALYFGTNPTVAGLSALNIGLYAFVYTPLKRISVLNTWVGAIVGGIPPLMGWVAAAGQTATTGHDTWRDLLFGPDSVGGWLMAGILFAWQFPHFNALSHTIREEYKNAGYRMLAWTNPARNSRVALRYSILMFPICAGLWWTGIVNNGFLVGSTLVNGWMMKEAYRFWKLQGANGSARGLFWASVWHLPLLMVGSLVAKKGIWDGVWKRIVGIPDEDDEYDEEEDDENGEVTSVEGKGGLVLGAIPPSVTVSPSSSS
ncbi:Protoheme IX farnesyltransferase, mitochondrial [Arachnomyces sp. PD_36]|nr:Protoheme IX farnesyltransferase, mitochondrial [Arachnomyces sp. PD_36]